MTKAKHYTIFTERKNVEGIKGLLNRKLDSYTLTECIGVWRGVKEDSLKEDSLRIDVLIFVNLLKNPYYFKDVIREICDDIRVLNKQESVLLIENNVDAELV